MKLSILTLALSLIFLSASVQEVTLNWTNVEKAETGIGFIGFDNTGTYCWSPGKNLTKLDNNNREIARNELEPIGDVKKLMFQPKIFLLGDRMWLVVSKYNKDEKARKVIAQEIDKATLKYKGDYKVISETHGEGFWTTEAETFIKPERSDKLVVTATSGEKPYFKLYDSNLEMLRNTTEFNFGNSFNCMVHEGSAKQFGMKIGKMDEVGIADVLCDADNNVFFDINYYPDKGSAVQEGTYIFAYLKEHNTPVKVQVNRPGKDAGVNSYIRLDEQNQVVCSGFYYETGSIVPAGIFYDKIDNKGNLVMEKREKLSDDIISGLSRTKDEAGMFLVKSPFEHSYPTKHFLFGSASDVYLSFECDKTQTANNDDNSIANKGTDYQEIICVHVTGEGRIAWQQKIPRWLKANNLRDSPTGYTSTVVNGKFYAFYIDNPKNVNVTDPKELKFVYPEYNKNVVITRENQIGGMFMATVSENGVLDRKVIENYNNPFAIHPHESLVKQKNEIVLTGYDCSYKTSGSERRLSKIGTLKIQ